MDRSTINHIGALLASIRGEGEDIIVAIGAHDGSTDTPVGHMSATVKRAGDTATGNAVALDDALHIARGKLNDAAKKRAAEKAKTPA